MSRSLGRTVLILLGVLAGALVVIFGLKWLKKNRQVRDGVKGAH